MLRVLLVTASLVTGVLGLAPAPSGAAENDVEFETLGIVSSTAGINLYPPTVLRVRDGEAESTRELLATGSDPSFADEVLAQIGEIPGDRVVLIGVIDVSCTPAATAGLRPAKDGDLDMYAPGHVPEPIECFVAVVTVAVLSVDADDAPPGSTDHADLVAFEFVGHAARVGATAAELTSDESALDAILSTGTEHPTLPPLDEDHRRFAFVRIGCGNTTAELIVTPQVVDARLDHDDPTTQVDCAQGQSFLAVFDVPADMVRDDTVVVGAEDR